MLLAACGGIKDQTPKQLVVENHWGGNTGGKGWRSTEDSGDAISNFVGFIAVLKRGEFSGDQTWAPLVITNSYYDETPWAGGAYANGKRVSKGQFYYSPGDFWPGIEFNKTTYKGITATIAHPSILSESQDKHEQQGLSLTTYTPDFINYPFRNNLPYVALSDERRIPASAVAYPGGVAFDNEGRLWVADNGPDQNYKIFSIPAAGEPEQVATFGDEGGVFAEGTGKLKGQTGEKRFWGPRGVGFGDNGEIIVGTTGIPGQVQGGTDVRAFDSSGKALWNVKAIFMHTPDIDPSSNGTQIYTAAQRFEMDYDEAPGASWRQAAVTLDPFRFPADPRLLTAHEISFIRVVNGKKFLFTTNMYGDFLGVFRFEANSEIAIPAAYFGIRWSERGSAWTQGKEPVWEGSPDENKNRRQVWRDANGNGAVDEGEFSDIQMPAPYAKGVDVDDNGNIWVGGKLNEHDSGLREGGNLFIPFGDIDANGVPFSGSVPRFVDIPNALIPIANQNDYAGRMRYLAATDTAIMATGYTYSYNIFVVDGHLKSTTPKLRFKLDLGYNDHNCQCNPDITQIDTSKMVLPNVIAADADYLYVGYIDNGPDAKVRGEITVYSMVDGHKVGWIVPGAVTNHYAGNFDMLVGLQVRKLADGTRVITAEENGAGKFMVYRWKP